MDREQLKELLPIIQAAVEGKAIEFRDSDHKYWQELTVPAFNLDVDKYRIKPEPKYRPFANAEECWEEMQKHQPFGWVKRNDVLYNIYVVSSTSVCLINGNCEHMDFAYAHQKLIFADGTPFGIIEWYEDSICNRVEVDPLTVGQYTGFKDKSGKEVYEGDTIVLDKVTFKVLWNEDLGGFFLKGSLATTVSATLLRLMIDINN